MGWWVDIQLVCWWDLFGDGKYNTITGFIPLHAGVLQSLDLCVFPSCVDVRACHDVMSCGCQMSLCRIVMSCPYVAMRCRALMLRCDNVPLC